MLLPPVARKVRAAQSSRACGNAGPRRRAPSVERLSHARYRNLDHGSEGRRTPGWVALAFNGSGKLRRGRASDLPRQARSAQERTLETSGRLILDDTESHDPMAATESVLRSRRRFVQVP